MAIILECSALNPDSGPELTLVSGVHGDIFRWKFIVSRYNLNLIGVAVFSLGCFLTRTEWLPYIEGFHCSTGNGVVMA